MKRTALTLALLVATSAASAAPWTYRGTLNDGGKAANGTYDLRVTLLNQTKNATVYGPLTLYDVKVTNGNFAADVDFGSDLSAAPAMALKTEVQQGNTGFVALGEATPFDPKVVLAGVCWDTEGNAGTNPATKFIGTTDNQALVLRANNKPALRIFPTATSPNLVSGAEGNVIGATYSGQVIAGGGKATNTCGPVSTASCLNLTDDSYATVSGGLGNTAEGDSSTVGGGGSNLAASQASTVSGGKENSATGLFSTISGGIGNKASNYGGNIGGGNDNTASGSGSTVSGGENSTASNEYSTVGGGSNNYASGRFSTVGGGFGNCAGGEFSWAGGTFAKVRPGNEPGDGTCTANSATATGDNGTFVWADDQVANFISTGPRQFLVRAEGGMAINTNTPTSGAALTVNGNVSVPSPGAIAFGNTTRQMLNLWGPNAYGIGVQNSRLYFRTGFTGGFSWFEGGVHDNAIDGPGVGGTLRMRLDNTGQLQTTTGTISTLSDARLKDQVVDYTRALDQINALRPVRFHYRDAGKAAFQAEGMHLGFIAQEVEQVFPEWVSQGEDGYLMLSLRGFEAVAVRGIQELSAENSLLSEKNSVLQSRLEQLQTQNASFEARLQALEKKR